jgi:hypothetical protein
MILSPSAAVADAEPKISHPMWAAAGDGAPLAENSPVLDVEDAAIGPLLSHARARPIATTPRRLASHLLHFIVPRCRSRRELRMHPTAVQQTHGGARARQPGARMRCLGIS